MSPPRSTDLITLLAWIALGLLAFTVLAGGLLMIPIAESSARAFPEFAHLQTPLLVAVAAFVACVEAMLGTTAMLVGCIRNNSIFGATALRLVDVLAGLLTVATVILAAVIPALPGPPLLVLVFLASVLVGATFVLVFLVLRSLLRSAVSMRVELDEVI
ncbi:hypothetical protein GCM10022381_09440 [Leifsonia kafniensis]|uniref:DUF2975 domain-containing protein n=1 Tax=Leifsonia kafniensis TaxID=475957 RepID=A0ABP7K9E1_9MICO